MIIVILGPTATKKSETAFKLAKKIDAEIINGDAFQIYKELNIGVAKPPKKYFDEIPHHLFSFISIDEDYSIFNYQKDLREKIEEIQNRGKNIIIVGGSLLYIRSGLYDYKFSNAKSDDKYRLYLESLDNKTLFELLKNKDEKEANKLHINNRRRLIRALEIINDTNEKKSSLIDKQKHKVIFPNTYFFSPIFNRSELYEIAEKRVDKMFKDGLVNEVDQLLKKHKFNLRALQAIGYKEIIHGLKNGYQLDETKEEIKKNTRNYIKRQITFLKHQFENINYYKDVEDIYSFYLNKKKNG